MREALIFEAIAMEDEELGGRSSKSRTVGGR